MIRQTIRRAGFPILLFSYAGLLWSFPEAGVLLLIAWALAGYALEQLTPYHEKWNLRGPEVRSDAAYNAGTIALSTGLKIALTVSAASIPISAAWPEQMPLFIRVILALLISGLLPYWLHRLAHESSGFLWRAHALHHAPAAVYSLNAFRIHPLNTAWNTVFGLLPLLLLGVDRETLLIAGGLNNFFSLFNHFNIDFENPWLARFFNTAELHRWHHSSTESEGNTNYSSGALSIWDQVFGTWYLPERKMPAEAAGLFGGSYPESFGKRMLLPFCNCA